MTVGSRKQNLAHDSQAGAPQEQQQEMKEWSQVVKARDLGRVVAGICAKCKRDRMNCGCAPSNPATTMAFASTSTL